MALVDSLIPTFTALPTLALPAFPCTPTPRSWQALFPEALHIGKAMFQGRASVLSERAVCERGTKPGFWGTECEPTEVDRAPLSRKEAHVSASRRAVRP